MLLPAVRIEIPLELAFVCLPCRKVTTKAHACAGSQSLLELMSVVNSVRKGGRGESPEPLSGRAAVKRYTAAGRLVNPS